MPPLLALLLCAAAQAAPPPRFHRMSEDQIAASLREIHASTPALAGRVQAVSERFLGTPYELGPLGEGEAGLYDRDPLISFRKADCTTLVEQVMALSLEPDLERAKGVLQGIRYRSGHVAYEDRNHFPELDWIPNNAAAGYIDDITKEVGGRSARIARKTVSKRDWYAAAGTETLKGFSGETPQEALRRARRLRSLGKGFSDAEAALPYLPLEDLPRLLARIPGGTIANLVREPRDDKPVLVTHQVLIVDKRGRKFVRHAAWGKAVEDVPAQAYFRRYAGSSWPLLGVNLNRIRSPR